MADDYIDRQKLLKDIEQYHLSDGKFQYWVEVQPSADVQTVRHGRWVDKSGGIEGAWNYCSECGEQAIDLFDYCPNCGARMDGEQNG